MVSLEKKTVKQIGIIHRFMGVMVLAVVGFILFIMQTIFTPTGDESFDQMRLGIQLFQSCILFVFVCVGIGLIFVQREMIYDEKTVEIRTSLFGKSWSRVVDRGLVRDLGPTALGLPNHNRRDLF